ncbi:NUDIX hydrolase [Candidatus Tenderia electrophaga]|jgi:8-oxo-dGTP pyrophosphatase MutT (NUDIX family)|uniref:Phosphatase NudJ n=1 Tax=Candidatus Tenderia electrophaga TaxID=1748243 RepID=A0A0S2TEB9_9GAMM|nr:NUDIX hydrolase [Candidatus Tenderia electrophaga]
MVWKPRVTVAAVIENQGKFLLVEEDSGHQAHTVFNQPAGHLEPGESLINAVIRETLEETGYDFTPTALVGLYRWIEPASGETFLRVCFSGEVGQYYPGHPLDAGIVGPRWLSVAEISELTPSLRSPLVPRCIEDYCAGRRFPLTLLSDMQAE